MRVRSISGHAPDRIKTGEMTFQPASEEEHATSFMLPSFHFTADHVRRFIAYNRLDERGILGEVMKGMKAVTSWGEFNGMRVVNTGEKVRERAVYVMQGAPRILPDVRRSVPGWGWNVGQVGKVGKNG